MIKSWSTTQTVVAMSSSESKYYGLARGGCEGIGVSGLVHNPTGKDLKIGLETDSSAANEERRGQSPAPGSANSMAARPG